MWKICCILILRIFQLILLSNLFPVSFGALLNVITELCPILLFTLYNTKNIACHIMKELIFYADKIMVMGNSKNLRVFIFAISLKSRKFYAREIYTVNHKKRWQYICDHNFGKSRSIFIIFALLLRGRNVSLTYEKMSTSPKYCTYATL